MHENTTRIAALAIGIIALGVALIYMGPTVDDEVKTMIMAVGFGMLAIAIIYSLQRRGEVMKDERTTKITNKSLAWSWYLTYLFLAVLIWPVYYGNIIISGQDVLSYTFFFMVFSAMFTKMYLSRRGDA